MKINSWKIISNKNSRLLQNFLMLKRSVINRFLNCIAKKTCWYNLSIYSRNQFVSESIYLSKANIFLNQELARESSLKTRLFESAILFVRGGRVSQVDHWSPKKICTSSQTKTFFPKALPKPVSKRELYHKPRTFFTSLTFYGEFYLSKIS